MKLVTSLTSPYGRKVRVVLLEKKIPFQLQVENPWMPDSVVPSLNPLGKVPVLVLEDGESVFDSRVIVEDLDNVSPVAHLIPGEPKSRMVVRGVEALADGVTDAAVALYLEKKRAPEQQSSVWLLLQEKALFRGLEALSEALGEKLWYLVLRWWQAYVPGHRLPFVDVFCERGAFSLAQSRRILEAARLLGFPLKIHADEFDNLGGASLAAELGAISADHLVKTSPADIAALASSQTVAVALPCTPFGLAESEYTPAQAILDAGGLLALASDLNPGTAWCGNMQFAIALACRYMKLTPAQSIAAATINAAAAIDRLDEVGSLEPGKQADLILLSVPDYRHLGYRFGTNLVRTVIKKGQVFPVSGA